MRVQRCVGAMRGCIDSGGLNIVSAMPSGMKTRSRANRSKGMPDTRATISPSRKKLISL